MDRNETVELSRLAAFDKMPIHKALKVITDYCLEEGKSERDIAVFRGYLATNPAMLAFCLNQALEYFEKKFVIYKLWSAPNLLDNMGQRKLLQIF